MDIMIVAFGGRGASIGAEFRGETPEPRPANAIWRATRRAVDLLEEIGVPSRYRLYQHHGPEWEFVDPRRPKLDPQTLTVLHDPPERVDGEPSRDLSWQRYWVGDEVERAVASVSRFMRHDVGESGERDRRVIITAFSWGATNAIHLARWFGCTYERPVDGLVLFDAVDKRRLSPAGQLIREELSVAPTDVPAARRRINFFASGGIRDVDGTVVDEPSPVLGGGPIEEIENFDVNLADTRWGEVYRYIIVQELTRGMQDNRLAPNFLGLATVEILPEWVEAVVRSWQDKKRQSAPRAPTPSPRYSPGDNALVAVPRHPPQASR